MSQLRKSCYTINPRDLITLVTIFRSNRVMALADSYKETATDTPSSSPSKSKSKRKTSFETTTNGTNKSSTRRSSLQLTFGGKKRATACVLDVDASTARLNEQVRT